MSAVSFFICVVKFVNPRRIRKLWFVCLLRHQCYIYFNTYSELLTNNTSIVIHLPKLGSIPIFRSTCSFSSEQTLRCHRELNILSKCGSNVIIWQEKDAETLAKPQPTKRVNGPIHNMRLVIKYATSWLAYFSLYEKVFIPSLMYCLYCLFYNQ